MKKVLLLILAFLLVCTTAFMNTESLFASTDENTREETGMEEPAGEEHPDGDYQPAEEELQEEGYQPAEEELPEEEHQSPEEEKSMPDPEEGRS